MKKKLRIGILFGGRSGEHEVSLLSAASILNTRGLSLENKHVMSSSLSSRPHSMYGPLYKYSDTRCAMAKAAYRLSRMSEIRVDVERPDFG